MRAVALILMVAVTTNAFADTEADRQARYEANLATAQAQAQSRIKPSAFTGVPVGAMLAGGSLAYSVSQSQSSNPYSVGSYAGAAASMLPYITNRTLSSVLNGR